MWHDVVKGSRKLTPVVQAVWWATHQEVDVVVLTMPFNLPSSPSIKTDWTSLTRRLLQALQRAADHGVVVLCPVSDSLNSLLAPDHDNAVLRVAAQQWDQQNVRLPAPKMTDTSLSIGDLGLSKHTTEHAAATAIAAGVTALTNAALGETPERPYSRDGMAVFFGKEPSRRIHDPSYTFIDLVARLDVPESVSDLDDENASFGNVTKFFESRWDYVVRRKYPSNADYLGISLRT
jgi:hypothetical protein